MFAIAIERESSEFSPGRVEWRRRAIRKTTPEERARWRENQERLERLLQKALAELGTTRDELHAKVGPPAYALAGDTAGVAPRSARVSCRIGDDGLNPFNVQ